MIKQIAILGILILISVSQSTVSPKTQKCECQNLLNQQDCAQQLGCAWILSNNTDSANITGSCATQNNTQTMNSSVTITQCSKIQNSTLCSKTIGCAYFNNTCVLFSGCSAYVQTTNSQCQAISSQCTTDGTRCVEPSPCPSYNTSSLCLGAKSCKWVETGTQANCVDKVCSDAPTSYNTDPLCDGFIVGCLSTGQGCTTSRQSCSTYLKVAGCTGMIGSDGQCTNNSDQGSTVCRPLTCTDAAITLSNNADCQKFLSGCLTTGKGCVKTLQSCSLYQQSQGCVGLIGSDGPCLVDSNSQTSCRAQACSDAPNSLNTNDSCNQFLNNCVTNEQGCAKTLGLCSSYNGNESQCNSYIGSDGNCKATSALSIQQCSIRTCRDAPKTINNDKDCNSYQKGCITNGAGCVLSLQLCQQYTGTSTTCLLYKGSEGNCMAPSTQTTDGPCSVKLCSAATSNTTTNSGCYSYSYKCVTNGTTCIDSPTCETTQQQITCEGNSACSYSQVCLDRSSCTNYSTQSQCSLNQQQYKLGSKTYLRKCQWTSGCQNTLCSSLATTLKTDADCEAALSGCITKGNGCVDINDQCSAYSGLIQTCQGFKGLNGQQPCSQLNTQTNPSTACVAITQCSQAKLYSSVTQTSNATCDAFLKGCYFDGNGGCTNGDCSTYYGTLTTCQNVNTAISSNKSQKCWKIDQPTNSASSCIPRTCAHATVTASELFNSDSLCQAFLSNCVWNGKSTGGCHDNTTPCSNYVGSLSQCGLFSQQKCTKTNQFCKSQSCFSYGTSSGVTQEQQQGLCQVLIDVSGFNCYYSGSGTTCQTPQTFYSSGNSMCAFYVPVGTTDQEKINFCQNIKVPVLQCTFITGEAKCNTQQCADFTAIGGNADQKATYCGNKYQYDSEKALQCGLKAASDTTCSLLKVDQDCSAYSINNESKCNLLNCRWSTLLNKCFSYGCTVTIPTDYQASLILKAKFCSEIYKSAGVPCTYSTVTGTENNCMDSKDRCEDVLMTPIVKTEKQQFCFNSKNSADKQCVLTGNDTSNCEDFSCSLFVLDISASNFVLQQFCLSQSQPCGYLEYGYKHCFYAGSCSDFKTFGPDAVTNMALCKKYIINGQSCVYSSGDSCKTFDCNDVTTKNATTCQAYHPSCYFDGVDCLAARDNCSEYIAQSAGEGQLKNCSNVSTRLGQKCGYSSSASKCKNRECSDVLVGSESICAAYISTCVFNGVGCSVVGNCSTYTAFGATDSERAAFCGSRKISGMGKCVYFVGQEKCQSANGSCIAYQTSLFSSVTPQIGCSLITDSQGASCSYSSGSSCSNLNCDGAPSTVSSDLDCQNFRYGCKLATDTQCTDKSCSSAPNTSTTDSLCATYKIGCVTNGAGCIESNSNCSDFKGTASTCANFKAKDGSQLCGNISSAAATDSCQNRSCEHNTTAKNDQDCNKWIPATGNVGNCVWNGTSGCVPSQQCSKFQGTIDTCTKYSATDGPCKGADASISACSTYDCKEAPLNYNTDAQCKQWGPTCMTNGNGCIPISQCQYIGQHSVCQTYKNTLGCDLANQCKTKPLQCTDFNNPSECNNTPIAGLTLPGCGWNQKTGSCGVLTCINLPLTLTTDQSCSQAISNCTTNGSGCIIKGACSTYNKQACVIAATTDIQKSCLWQNSSSTCRPIQCTDNTSATTDVACDSYLKGCKTTGSGCAQSLTCQQYTLSQLCIQDTNGNPCLWFKTQQSQSGSCINYTKCSDIISSSHQDCQNASPHCTTNGTNCIAITSCSKTQLQASCTIGTDGICGWMPTSSGSARGQCTLYTNCAAAKGTTTQQCKAWGKQCISDGISCIETSTCSSYSTQQACSNSGTNGICFWQQAEGQTSQGTCRLQVCADATTNNSTHSGCSSFQASTQCTTSGTGCIQLGTCQSYKSQAGCVVGTDGQCFWQQSQNNSTDSSCRLKQCTDNNLTTSSACLNSISGLKCVSDGQNCIKQGLCEIYTTKEACLGGGTDGQCAFIPNSNIDQTKGKCQLFNSCGSANQDQQTCLTRQDSCYFNSTTINGTITTSCLPHTCSSKAQASSCQPIPSFDLQSYQICVLMGTQCQSGSPTQLTSADCYINSIQTYTWSPTTQSCRTCKSSSQVNNTNNQTNETRSDSQGFLISLCIIIAINSI